MQGPVLAQTRMHTMSLVSSSPSRLPVHTRLPLPLPNPNPNPQLHIHIRLPPPPPSPRNSIPPPSTASGTAANPRRRKDAVLRATHASAGPGVADADADDAAVRAAALLARFADIGAELEGTVRERGAALWAALSRRRAPLDLPVPPLPRTRSSAALIAARGAPVVEASRAVAHQAAWRARFAAYGRLFGTAAEQV